MNEFERELVRKGAEVELAGLDAKRRRLEKLLNPANGRVRAIQEPKVKRRSKMSPEGRAKISAIQKARWALLRATQAGKAKAPTTRKGSRGSKG